jgi:fatty-acyl-CoA synthase
VRGLFIAGSNHELPPEPEKFTTDVWLRTGDFAAIDRHGYMRIADRTKDLIKSGSKWINSVDIENRLMGHDAVQEAAVTAFADAKWGERPLACVVLKEGSMASAEDLRAHLAGAFAKWQLPEHMKFLDTIPRTSTGKLWKVKLREMCR